MTTQTSQLITQIQAHQTNHMQTSQTPQTVFPPGPGPGGPGNGNATGLFDQMRQTDSMPDMGGMGGMGTDMTNMANTNANTTTTGKPVPIVGVLAGVVAVVVIALIVVVVYFVAVRKKDCTACAPVFDFTAPSTFVSCDANQCKGTQSPWAGHWCTSLDNTAYNRNVAMSGDSLYNAEQAMSGVAADSTWQGFADACKTQSCIGASITQDNANTDSFTFTPCLAQPDGSASTTRSRPHGQPPNVWLYAPKANM